MIMQLPHQPTNDPQELKAQESKQLEKGESKSQIQRDRLTTPRKSQSIIEVHSSDGEVILIALKRKIR